MKEQERKEAKVIHPTYTEAEAKAIVEKQKKFRLRKKEMEWVSSIPLFVPFWLVDVEMTLKDMKRKLTIEQVYQIMVNGMTNRGMLVRGDLKLDDIDTMGIFMDHSVAYNDIAETARLEALSNTKRMIKPPPHRVLSGSQKIFYPLALVELKVNGKEEIQVFDYYRGGIDKYMMHYLNLKDRMEEKKSVS